MARYVMSFNVPEERPHSAQKIIDHYFAALHIHEPGGMYSQCYTEYKNACKFIHIKSFKRESVACNCEFRQFQDEIIPIAKSLKIRNKQITFHWGPQQLVSIVDLSLSLS